MSSVADRVFLDTMRRFAAPRLAAEDVRVALRLLSPLAGPLGDLGCGYGRHLRELLRQGVRRLIGVDRSPLLLREAAREAPGAPLVRADLRALPIASASLGGATCFYSSMFLGADEDTRAVLSEAARALRPGGRLVLTTDNPLRLAARPQQSWAEEVVGLGRVAEESVFDAASGVDRVTRQVCTPSGEKLSATFVVRYYLPEELSPLARAAGLRLVRLEPDAPLTDTTPQLVALLERMA